MCLYVSMYVYVCLHAPVFVLFGWFVAWLLACLLVRLLRVPPRPMLQAAGKTRQVEVKQGMQEGHESAQKLPTLRRQRTADRKCQTISPNQPGARSGRARTCGSEST